MKTQNHPELEKKLKSRHFFSLAFGCIIGVGWIIVLGDWLEQAGPLGAILGFAGGTLMMILIGLCYAELAAMIPVTGGEIAYTYEVLGTKASFGVGWFLALAYIAVTIFEAVSVGWVTMAIFPGLRGNVLYSIRGDPVEFGGLILGVGGMILIISLNYRGVKTAATFQEIFTFGLLIFAAVFIAAGLIWGKVSHLQPLFSKDGAGRVLGSVLAIFMTTPFWLAGFNVIPQTMEEKAPGIPVRKVVRMTLFSIGIAGCFYMLIIFSTSMTIPWKKLIPLELPVAGAFEAAFNSSLGAKIVLSTGFCGIVTSWNTVFISASRIIFALSRGRIIPGSFSRIQKTYGSPFVSILFVGIISTAGVFLGRSAILPIVNVAGSCFAMAFVFSCFCVLRLRYTKPNQHRPYRIPGGKGTATIGFLSGCFVLFLSFYQPYANSEGSFPIEWAFILGWAVLGILFWIVARKIRAQVSESERHKLILGKKTSVQKPKKGAL